MATRIEIPDHVVFQLLDEQAVLLNLETGAYFTLNRSATRVWKLIAETREVERVREAMLEEYEVDAAALDGDLRELLSELTERGLIIRDAP